MQIRKIAIVGAGISGASAASLLSKHGFEIQIFEKSRGCGGRMATRRSSGYEFDHGAQYFTVRDEAFRSVVEEWVSEASAEPWRGRFATVRGGRTDLGSKQHVRYVGTPRMNSVVHHLTRGIETEFETRIARLEKMTDRWQLISDQGTLPGSFDAVVLTTPSAQASLILGSQSPFQPFLETPMHPCWAVMTAFERPLNLPFDAAFVKDSSLSWVSRNSSKPQRKDPECWVLHGSPEWSRKHFDAQPEWVTKTLLSEFFEVTRQPACEASWIMAHRWRYAQAVDPDSTGFFWDSEARLGVCGDWCHGSRVEGAFLSGKAIAERIMETTTGAG